MTDFYYVSRHICVKQFTLSSNLISRADMCFKYFVILKCLLYFNIYKDYFWHSKSNLPQLSGAVIACNILKDLEGIELPVYFFGSGTVCSLGWI